MDEDAWDACLSRFFATDSSASLRRPTRTTLAPSDAKRLAVAAPMPEPAPVTRTVLPEKRCMILVSLQTQEFPPQVRAEGLRTSRSCQERPSGLPGSLPLPDKNTSDCRPCDSSLLAAE